MRDHYSIYNTHMKIFAQFDDELSPLWERALSAEKTRWPFYELSWHKMWQKHMGHKEKITIISDKDRGVVIPLAITDSTAHFTGGEEIADYLDAYGSTDKKTRVWEEVLPELKRLGAKTLVLRNIPGDSPTVTYFEGLEAAEVSEEDTTPILALPENFDAYLQSLGRKERHELKRKNRKFETEHPDIRFEAMTEAHIDSLLTLMRKNSDKDTFLTPDMEHFFRDLPLAAGNTLRQFSLVRDFEYCATTLAFQVDTSLLLYNSGYNPDIEGSGWYLKTKIVESAISQSLKSINFLQGGERYKYDLGAADFLVYRVNCPL